MIRFSFLNIFYFVFTFFGVMAQNTESLSERNSALPGKYDRNSLTVLLYDKGGNYSGDLKAAIAKFIPLDKFDDNSVTIKVINNDNKYAISQSKVPNQIIAKWFSRQSDGSFDITLLQQRGLYNATDKDVLQAQNTKRGNAALEDAGESLINHSYILVLNYNKISTMDEYYDAQDAIAKKTAESLGLEYNSVTRNKNGYLGILKGHLYKIDFNDSISAVFWQELWVGPTDGENIKNERRTKFDNFLFPVKDIMEVQATADGSQYNADVSMLAPPQQKSREELMSQLIQTGAENAIGSIEMKYEPFRVKTSVQNVKPVVAKVGLKEGLSCDQRYFVLEFVQDDKGATKAKRKAVVRVKKVVDNRQIATGKTDKFTSFYQVAGFGIDPGMTLQQRNDMGIALSLGYSTGNIGGLIGRLEYNLSKPLGVMLKNEFSMTQFKFYIAGGGESRNDYDTDVDLYSNILNNRDVNFLRYTGGFSKGYYFLHFFSIFPFVGGGVEQAKIAKNETEGIPEEINIQTYMINAGMGMTMNLHYNVQLFGIADYYLPIMNAMDKKYKDLKDNQGNSFTYNDVFKDRSGSTINFGLRFEF